MNITRDQWNELETLARKAGAAARDLEHRLLMLALDHKGPERDLLLKLARDTADGNLPCPYMLHPQQEWMGGDSSDPANTKIREPHIVGLRREYLK